MVNYVSPGVYTIEKDISEYAPSINTSIVGVVGFAGKGPTNKATLITSQNSLITTFGEPNEGIPGQALEGSLEILEQTSNLYFVRAIGSGATDASALMSLGSCPAVIVSGGATETAAAYGVGTDLYLQIQVYNNNGTAQFATPRQYSIPAGTATAGQAQAIRSIVGGSLEADKVGCFDGGQATNTSLGLSGALVGQYAGSGASIGVSAYTDSNFDVGLSALYPVSATNVTNYGVSAYGTDFTLASAVRAYGSTFIKEGASSTQYSLLSLYEGNGYNGGTRTDGTASGNAISVTQLGGGNFNLNVVQDGVASEQFNSSFLASGNFIEDVINTGETNLTSDVIKGNIMYSQADVDATKQQNFGDTLGSLIFGVTAPDGTDNFVANTQFLYPSPLNENGTADPLDPVVESYVTEAPGGGRWSKLLANTGLNMAGGTNGTEDATALIGDSTVDPKTGMQSLDDETINIGLAVVPGIATQSVQNNLITLAENTQDFLALVAPPYGIGTAQDAIDWTNGKSASTAGSRTAAINSSFAAVHWPWLKVFSVFDGKDRWYDPSIFAARQMCYTDSVADSWIAPAGFQRGRLTKPVDTEVKLNQGDRDALYSGGNIINPIASFPQQGLTIWGQRTTQRSPSALDRINVRRLMIYVRKVILQSTRRFVFEPNDEFTWAQIEGVLNPFLDDIRRRRGITEFRVVCDSSVNTPVRVDRNELWTKVLIKPTKTAEILIFEINLTNQSAQLGNL
jgi:phage tail sheath protein FI